MRIKWAGRGKIFVLVLSRIIFVWCHSSMERKAMTALGFEILAHSYPPRWYGRHGGGGCLGTKAFDPPLDALQDNSQWSGTFSHLIVWTIKAVRLPFLNVYSDWL